MTESGHKTAKKFTRMGGFYDFFLKNANLCVFLIKKITEVVDKRKFLWYNVYIHTFAFPPLSW